MVNISNTMDKKKKKKKLLDQAYFDIMLIFNEHHFRRVQWIRCR